MNQWPPLWDDDARPTARGMAFDGTVGIALAAAAVLTAAGGIALPVVATALTMGLAVAVRRLSWRVMVMSAAASGACQLLAGELVVLSDVGYAVVAFTLGAHTHSGVRRLGLGGALTVTVGLMVAVAQGVVGEAVTNGSATFAAIAAGAMALTVAGGGWGLGYVRWQSRQRLRAQVRAGWEQERALIAADMHDLVAHTWAVVAAQADGARYALGTPGGQRQAAESLALIAETARASIADVRRLLAELHLREAATAPARRSRDALVERVRASGMDVRFEQHGRPPDVSGFEVEAYRLLAEALTNALKHGDLRHPVRVEEDWRGGYRLLVQNRIGRPGAIHGRGHGLDGMRTRVTSAGGSFDAGADRGAWRVHAVVPGPVR